MIGAAFGVGFVLGPALGGLLGNSDPRLPFWVAAGLSLANGLYGFFVSARIASAREAQRLSPCVARTRSGASCCCGPIRNCSGSRPSNSSATSRTKSSISGRSTRFFVTPGGKARSDFRSRMVGACSIVDFELARPAIVSRFGERRTLYIGQFFGAIGMVFGRARAGPERFSSSPFR